MIRRAQGQAEAGKLRAPHRGFGVTARRLRPGRAANDNHQALSRRLGRWPLLAVAAFLLGALGVAAVILAS